MKAFFSTYRYSQRQKEIISTCREDNEDAYGGWSNHNAIYPILIIIASAVAYVIASTLTDNIVKWESIILNGGISLVGINILSAANAYQLNSKSSKKNPEYKGEHMSLFSKLKQRSSTFIVLGTIAYALQIMFYDFGFSFDKYPYICIGFFCLAILILWYSIKIGGDCFIIQDEFYKRVEGQFSNAVSEGSRNIQDEFDQMGDQ